VGRINHEIAVCNTQGSHTCDVSIANGIFYCLVEFRVAKPRHNRMKIVTAMDTLEKLQKYPIVGQS